MTRIYNPLKIFWIASSFLLAMTALPEQETVVIASASETKQRLRKYLKKNRLKA